MVKRHRIGLITMTFVACGLALPATASADASLGGAAVETAVPGPATQGIAAPNAIQAGGDLLVILGFGGGLGYGYDDHQWTELTALINTAASSVTTAPNAEDLDQLLQFDSIWLDQRWETGSLTSTEAANLAAYIATGGRIVMIGENSDWAGWNSQILGLVGGSYLGGESENPDTTDAIGSDELLDGVSQISLIKDGFDGGGGTVLFDKNVAKRWGDNVVTILSVNVMGQGWGQTNNAQFMTNVVAWLLESSIGGDLTGQTGDGVLCKNFTQQGPVVGELMEGETSWSCTEKGLVADPGDIIVHLAIGTAVGSAGGSLRGQSGLGVLCKNLTTQGAIVGKLLDPSETEWNCNDLGMQSSPGDMIFHAVAGSAD